MNLTIPKYTYRTYCNKTIPTTTQKHYNELLQSSSITTNTGTGDYSILLMKLHGTCYFACTTTASNYNY